MFASLKWCPFSCYRGVENLNAYGMCLLEGQNMGQFPLLLDILVKPRTAHTVLSKCLLLAYRQELTVWCTRSSEAPLAAL